MDFDIQLKLENKKVDLIPLQESDFEDMFLVASDPKIWEQHPNKDRWKKEIFRIFFDGALMSKGAFKIVSKETQNIIGSTRFYDFDVADNSIFIGYTFYATAYWGKGINALVKKTMLDYIFQFISKVYFHIGAKNIRSQIAIQRIGATKISEQDVAYFCEEPRLNFVYCIEKPNANKIHIKEINSTQAKLYKSFLMEGLVNDENNFRISPNDEFKESFPTLDKEDSFTLGAFLGKDLCGIVSFERDGKNREKLKHKGILFRMYVSKDYRGNGISKLLIDKLLEKAKAIEGVEQINLTVLENNKIAIRLYEKFGFKKFAMENRGIKYKGNYFNEIQMSLKFI
jgi:N-acetyltransferase